MAKATTKAKPAKASFNPFENVAESKSKKSGLDSLDVSPESKASIDRYVEISQEIKLLEGEKETHKDSVTAEARMLFAKRQLAGEIGNFKLMGKEATVTYIVQNAGSMLSQENIQEITASFGKKAADELTELDYASMKFKKDFILEESNRERILKALAKEFSQDELKAMFESLSYKVSSDVVDSAPKFAKTADQLDNLYMALKVKAFIKV